MIFTRRSAASSTSTHPAISRGQLTSRKSVRTTLITSSAQAADSEPELVVVFDFDQPALFGEQERRSARQASRSTHHNSGVRGVGSVSPRHRHRPKQLPRALELVIASSKPHAADRASTGSAVSFPSSAVHASRCSLGVSGGGGERLPTATKSAKSSDGWWLGGVQFPQKLAA
jgi:hypothetical protein